MNCQGQTPKLSLRRAVATLALTSLLPLGCHSVHLDIHVPLPEGCLKYHALLANRILREASRSRAPPSQTTNDDGGNETTSDDGGNAERVDLFSLHTPHVTLYLADFDLEVDDANDTAKALNETKVDALVGAISSLNFTELISGWNCSLSLSKDASTSAYYEINGAYAMLSVEDTPCLQTLSTTFFHSLQSYVRRPVVVPSWVASLPEPARSAAIYRTRTFGSPNVLEGFDPHVTVGFYSPPAEHDSNQTQDSLQRRADGMKRWNDSYEEVHEACINEAQGVALGKTGAGGTVLADSRVGYWKLVDETKGDGGGNGARDVNGNGFYAVVE